MAGVIDRDLGWNKIIRDLQELDGTEISAGVLKNAGSDSRGTPYADIAIYNEYGTRRIPARPAVRIASDEHKGEWQDVVAQGIDATIAGHGNKQALCDKVGKKMVKDIQSIFGDKSKLKGNAPATIKKKGRDDPLIDTGKLRSVVNYRVEE
jgi:hypothetical protein